MSLGAAPNNSGPLGGYWPGPQPGCWVDSLDVGACVSGLVVGCLPGHVDIEWALVVNKGSITSSPIFVPSVPNFSLGFMREANVSGDKGKGTALSALVGRDLGCESRE